MRKLVLPVIAVAALAMLFVGCGKSPGVGQATPTASSGGGGTAGAVSMGPTTFVQTSVTAQVGKPVQFADPQGTGGFHILCLGHNQTCKSNPDGPAELNTPAGVTFNQGDTKSFTFTKAGTYEVTCTVHPNMNVTITVQ